MVGQPDRDRASAVETVSIEIHTTEIHLDGVLKFSGLVDTGGEAKQLIQGGHVRVNGVLELQRGRPVRAGDRVELLDDEEQVQLVLEIQAGAP